MHSLTFLDLYDKWLFNGLSHYEMQCDSEVLIYVRKGYAANCVE